MPSSKTTNLDLNYGYEPEDKTTVWLDGLDNNFQILDSALGTVFKAISDAGIILSRDVELHDEWSTGTYLLSTTFLTGFKSAPSVTNGNYIYVFIGKDDVEGDIYKFDALRYTLSKVDITLPSGFTNFLAEVNQGIVYLFAGKQNGLPSDLIYTYNIGTNHVQLFDTTLPQAITNSCSCLVGDDIYLFGGIDNSNDIKDSIIKIDLNEKSSSLLSLSLNQPLSNASVEYINNYIYLFGGENESPLNTIYKIDLDNNSITLLSTEMQYGLYLHRTCILGNYIYLFGGISSSGLTDKIYRFNYNDDSLIILNFTLPMSLADFAISPTSDYIYIFGGATLTSDSPRIIRFVP